MHKLDAENKLKKTFVTLENIAEDNVRIVVVDFIIFLDVCDLKKRKILFSNDRHLNMLNSGQ